MEIRPLDFENLQQAIDGAVAVFGENDRAAIQSELLSSLDSDCADNFTDTDVRITHARYFVAMQDGAFAGITGYYQLEDHKEDVWLGWIGVAQEYRRGGLGATLLKESFNRAATAEENIKNFRIWTTAKAKYDNARRLYAREGFEEECYKPDGSPASALIRVFSRRADPEATHAYLWAETAYRVDCENHEIPFLDREILETEGDIPQLPPPQDPPLPGPFPYAA